MSRFFKLVHNEYIKIFKKGSTIALLIMMLLVIAGFEILLVYSMRAHMDPHSHENENSYEYLEQEILSQNNEKFKNEKIQILHFMSDNNITEMSLEGEALMSYVGNSFSKDSSFPADEVAGLEEKIKDGDWKETYRYVIDKCEVSDSIIWEMSFRLEHDAQPDKNNDYDTIISDIRSLQVNESGNGKKTLTSAQQNRLDILTYQVKNNILINVADYASMDTTQVNTWSAWSMSSGLVYVIAVVMMIIAGTIVANEHSQGTIKFLLVNPVKRWKILASKLFTVMTVAIIMLIIVFCISGLCASLFIGSQGQKAAWLTVENGKVTESSPFLFMIVQWLLQSITMFVLTTLAFSLSTFSRKSSIAIALSIVSIFVGSTITSLLRAFECDWGRFLLFSNLDISGIAAGNAPFYRQSVGFAVFVIIEHMAVFLITAFDSFRKKSV